MIIVNKILLNRFITLLQDWQSLC